MDCLSIRDVDYRYTNKHQTVHAVKSATADFSCGSFSIIMGKSGSGKSTLLSLLAGLDHPSDGEV